MVNIRSFKLSDYRDVIEIWSQTATEEREAQTLNTLANQLAHDRDLVLVAEHNSEVVGAIMGTKDGSRGFFYCLAVNPAYQNQGIGRQLVAALEARFYQKGAKKLLIMVDDGTKKLMEFYHNLGFQCTCSSALEKEVYFHYEADPPVLSN
ncbi:GNAT family N-acetyltransferase [Numidum massiliense]|uniref:GNAT family N-acetyltransferase n=1 Tax=Numidum massiliense TaxID=1522315 RepID=UPI0006D597DC|nr:GNAT family N-acetyltransferase [Numidum massiliense]